MPDRAEDGGGTAQPASLLPPNLGTLPVHRWSNVKDRLAADIPERDTFFVPLREGQELSSNPLFVRFQRLRATLIHTEISRTIDSPVPPGGNVLVPGPAKRHRQVRPARLQAVEAAARRGLKEERAPQLIHGLSPVHHRNTCNHAAPSGRAILLEQNDEWSVQRARYMTLETIAPLRDDLTLMLPAAAA